MCAETTPVTADAAPSDEELSPSDRILANPTPALRWGAVAAALLAVEFGAFVAGSMVIIDAVWIGATAILELLVSTVSPGVAALIVDAQQAVSGIFDAIRVAGNGLPTLLSRDVFPNAGYKTGPNGPWVGTFLGLQPAYAWAIRTVVIVAYSLFAFYWVFRGWLVYREHYRTADWTPRDDAIERLRGHRWAQFGIAVVLLFVTMALFAPTLGPTTVEDNIQSPYSHEFQYYNEDAGEVQTVTAGRANFYSKSKGAGDQNVAPMTYDRYGRFHPFGTITNGRDLFTFMMAGARISLVVATIATGLAALIATMLGLISAYYSGSVDLTVLTLGDGVASIPLLLLLILVASMFTDHWLNSILDGGFLIALTYGLASWPFLWRAIRGPAFQTAQEEWIDAAKSFGQRPRTIMTKHILPHIGSYMLIYASLNFGAIIIVMAALSFLGVGISPPTPAWGRAVALGDVYVSSPSWHIAAIPGIMIVFVVTGLNALGDGIRDAIDPESEGGQDLATGGGG